MEFFVKNRNLILTRKNSCSEDSLAQGDECADICDSNFVNCLEPFFI